MTPPSNTPADESFKELQRSYHDQVAAQYDQAYFRKQYTRNVLIRLRAMLDRMGYAGGPGKILEIGAGTGTMAAWILKHTPLTYWGIDLSPNMLEVAKEKLTEMGVPTTACRLECGDAGNLAYPDGMFDYVFGTDILHHVPDVPRTFRECRRVLRPGGHMVFMESNPKFPLAIVQIFYPAERKVFQMTRKNLVKWAAEAGLAAEVEPIPLFTPPFPAALFPLYDRLDRWLHRIPLIRECALSLVVHAPSPPYEGGARGGFL